MTPTPAPRVLLGPQRPVVNLGDAVRAAGVNEGPVAVISAGWQEAEGDIADVQEATGLPLEDLCLYQRADAVLAEDPSMAEAYRQRQDRLIEQQRLYRLRLGPLAQGWRTLWRCEGDPDMLAAEKRHAIAQLRALDRHHLHRTESIHREFETRYGDAMSGRLAQHINEIREMLTPCRAVIMTGGNVTVLLNRLRLFDIPRLIAPMPVIGWSAGAMVLAERIVLFHDRTPQGRREPEVLGAGLGLIGGCIILPDAERRLRRGDRTRIAMFSRRFAPDTCYALDSGSMLCLESGAVSGGRALRRLRHDGRIVQVHPR